MPSEPHTGVNSKGHGSAHLQTGDLDTSSWQISGSGHVTPAQGSDIKKRIDTINIHQISIFNERASETNELCYCYAQFDASESILQLKRSFEARTVAVNGRNTRILSAISSYVLPPIVCAFVFAGEAMLKILKRHKLRV